MAEVPKFHLTEKLHRAIHAGLKHEVEKLVKDGAELDRVLGMRGTALCAAIEARNLEIVKYLLQQGCDVNTQDYDGEPPVLLALRKDSPGHISGRNPDLQIVETIIKHENCNVNKIDPLTRKTALHFAVEQGMVDAVSWILSTSGKFKCDINVSDSNGNTPLHLAVHEGVYKVVHVLVNHQDVRIKVYNNAGLTPIHICANTGDVKSLAILLKHLQSSKNKSELKGDYDSELSINVNAVTKYEKDSPLHLAARNGHVDVVNLLLNNQAHVDVMNNFGQCPLILSMPTTKHRPSQKNDIPLALLQKGASVNMLSITASRYLNQCQQVTPLILATQFNNLELVKCLVEKGSDVNVTDDDDRNTPLMIALKSGIEDIASFLLREFKDINTDVKNRDGETCLHAVIKGLKRSESKGFIDLTRNLIQRGVETSQTDVSNCETVLQLAIEFNNHAVIDVILEESGDKAMQYVNNPIDDEGRLLIHMAVAHGSLDMVNVLLSHGADINARTSEGQSNLYIALFNAENNLVTFLVENGCDLTNESYIYLDNDNNEPKKVTCTRAPSDFHSDTSESDSTDYDSDLSDEDVFRGDYKLKHWLRDVAFTPRSLRLTCLVTIRKYFIKICVPFHKIDLLGLPESFRSQLRYKI